MVFFSLSPKINVRYYGMNGYVSNINQFVGLYYRGWRYHNTIVGQFLHACKKRAPRDELSDIEVNVPDFIFKLHLKRQFNVLHNVGS